MAGMTQKELKKSYFHCGLSINEIIFVVSKVPHKCSSGNLF